MNQISISAMVQLWLMEGARLRLMGMGLIGGVGLTDSGTDRVADSDGWSWARVLLMNHWQSCKILQNHSRTWPQPNFEQPAVRGT